MKARNVSKGDWITVGGKPVKVTRVTRHWGGWVDDGKIDIEYERGTRSGILRRGADTQVAHLAGKRGTKGGTR